MKRLKYLLPWRRRAEEQDMREELESLAALAPRGELGNLTRAAENARAVWGWTWLEQTGRDLHYALRALRKNPGFAATAVLSLALGIGANTAIFSLIDALLLRWLPVRDPHELIRLVMVINGNPANNSFSYPEVRGLEEQAGIFTGVCGFSLANKMNVGPRDAVENAWGMWVSGSYYDTLGVVPQRGRLLTRDDDREGAAPVAVITDGYWERRYGRDPRVLGTTVAIEGAPFTIVGVSPPGFTGANVGQDADFTLPLGAQPQTSPGRSQLVWSSHWLRVLARPRPGISVQQIRARLAVVWPPIRDGVIPEEVREAQRRRAQAVSLDFVAGGTGYTNLRQQFERPLLVLMAVVGLVLLIACANVANLLLARANARQREIAVRLAIGAGRWRIVRQLLTESLLLSVCGAALGVGMAWIGGRMIVNLLSNGEAGAMMFDLTPNAHVLGFTGAVSVLTGLLFGLAPAFRATRSGVLSARGSANGSGRLAGGLVAAQVALSLLLLVAAGLFLRTLQNLRNLDPGFRSEGVLMAAANGSRLGLPRDRVMALYRDLLRQIQDLPGVASASFSALTPLSGAGISNQIFVDGSLAGRGETLINRVSPRYFETLGTAFVLGRDFTLQDDSTAPKVAIVNELFASRYFPEGRPLGRQISTTGPAGAVNMEIVGVVGNANYDNLREKPEPVVYTPYLQTPTPFTTFEVHAVGSVADTASRLRATLQAGLPGSVVEVRTLNSQVERTLVRERLMATLAAGFGALALTLAAVGLYGMLSYGVSRRTNEIGVRMAIGAGRGRVLRMVIRDALALLLIGVMLGLPAAWAASRLVTSMLFHLEPTDAATITAAVIALVAVGIIAALAPAVRAAQIDPMAALRHE